MKATTPDNFPEVSQVLDKPTPVASHGSSAKKKEDLQDINAQSQKIQEVIERIESFKDGESREIMLDCIREILGFYGAGLSRILRIVSESENVTGKDIYDNLLSDKFINGLLLIHDIHPLSLEQRLDKALQKVRPYMDSHGGNVEITSLENGVAKLKLSGSCKGCPSSAITLELAIKQAIQENCPDLLNLEVEGVVALPGTNNVTHDNGNESGNHPTSWKTVEGVSQLSDGEMKGIDSLGKSLVFFNLKDKFYAYKNNCPACDIRLNTGHFEDGIVTCKLGHSYEIQKAGKCVNDPAIHLIPVPLLQEDGKIEVIII